MSDFLDTWQRRLTERGRDLLTGAAELDGSLAQLEHMATEEV